jgi:uncharacterized protein
MLQGIFDVHAHAFPEKVCQKAVQQLEKYYDIKIPNLGSLQGLQESAKAAKVTHVALHMAATNPQQVEVANDWIGDVSSPNIIGFGTLHPDYFQFTKEIERIYQKGIRGIKFHSEFQKFPLDDPRMWPIYEALEGRFIVMFHMGDKTSSNSAPSKLAKVLDAFPKMQVIAAHLGGWFMWEEAENYLYQRDIYLDTSSTNWCLPPAKIAYLIQKHGVDKVLFGSDYPITTHQEEVNGILNLPISEEDKEKILWHNGAKLFGLKI